MPAATRTPVELSSAPVLRIIAIAAGGALGTLARYGVERAVAVSTDGFPWATFAVNVAGSFLLGVILTLVTERWAPTRYIRPFGVIGFCGGFTTFSTFTVEAVRRTQDGHPAVAVVYLLTSLAAGMAAVALGVLVARGGRVEPDHLLSADPDADPTPDPGAGG